MSRTPSTRPGDRFDWLCEGCKSKVWFVHDDPLNCFAQGMMMGVMLAHHRSKCPGSHYENGTTGGPSIEEAFLGAVENKSWATIKKQARSKQGGDA